MYYFLLATHWLASSSVKAENGHYWDQMTSRVFDWVWCDLAGALYVVLDDCNERNILKKSCGNSDKSFTKEVAKVDDIKRGHSTWDIKYRWLCSLCIKEGIPIFPRRHIMQPVLCNGKQMWVKTIQDIHHQPRERAHSERQCQQRDPIFALTPGNAKRWYGQSLPVQRRPK